MTSPTSPDAQPEGSRPVAGEGDGRARQAVVLIHGIGDQRPMGTLRGFVDGLDLGRAWSKPDRLSDNLELRRMSVFGRYRPPTDLYELYWAHHSPESSPTQVLSWALRMLLRPRAWRGSPVAPLVALIQLVGLLSAVAAVVILVLTLWQDGLAGVPRSEPLWITTAIALLQGVSRPLLSRRIADAQRYLSPRPDNIESRTAIRREGLELLRRLHTAGVYERVVVVGHSLGSVIGYDILRLYWDEARHPDIDRAGRQPEVEQFSLDYPDPLSVRSGAVHIFQEAQHRLWREFRERGVPWLVTDFITLGSPLCHARVLLETPDASLQRRQDDLEFPTCPPMPSLDPQDVDDEREPAFIPEVLRRGSGEDQLVRQVLVGNHGALFGPTRWTNLYFPVRRWVGGDLVAGPLAPVFGTGILDIPVRHSTPPGGWWRRWVPLRPHLLYWAPLTDPDAVPSERERRRAQDRRLGTKEAVPALVHALGLDTRRSRRPLPPPDPAGP
ncbi:hypothetical protein [Serinicoccus kebangsaanensis]|uniref:hypothetical protein n=1 Tax=Serinicoccus kebangsaanensis TaxID=2602069 RepID=UPI00124C395D|nr:hypothetical protein [Serinicoccus kebangsaanensis]